MPYEAGVLARIRSCNPVNAGLTASLATAKNPISGSTRAAKVRTALACAFQLSRLPLVPRYRTSEDHHL